MRSFGHLLAAWLGAASLSIAHTGGALEPPIPALPMVVAVASQGGQPVRDSASIDAFIAEAERIFGPTGVHVRKLRERPLPERHARLETRKDRDALAAEMTKGVINVMVVASLRDVDDPSLYRMGVHWRPGGSPFKQYIIVAADASRTTLAHELGHYFGNGHSAVMNNLMSYSRDDDTKVFLDDRQASKTRAFARLYLRTKELVALAAQR